jgi:hypothetical protein
MSPVPPTLSLTPPELEYLPNGSPVAGRAEASHAFAIAHVRM